MPVQLTITFLTTFEINFSINHNYDIIGPTFNGLTATKSTPDSESWGREQHIIIMNIQCIHNAYNFRKICNVAWFFGDFLPNEQHFGGRKAKI